MSELLAFAPRRICVVLAALGCCPVAHAMPDQTSLPLRAASVGAGFGQVATSTVPSAPSPAVADNIGENSSDGQVKSPPLIYLAAGESNKSDAPSYGMSSVDQKKVSAKRWGVAPIRWGWAGKTSFEFTRTQSNGGPATTATVNAVSFGSTISSYIRAPWYISLDGDATVGLTKSQSGTEADKHGSRNVSITGSGRIRVFPQSRFPVEVWVNRSENRSEAVFSQTASQNWSLGVNHSYRPLRRDGIGYQGRFQHDVSGTDTGVKSTRDTFEVNSSHTFGGHDVSATSAFSRSAQQPGGTGASSLTLNLSDSFRLAPNLHLGSNASYGLSTFDFGGATLRSQTFQASSSASWSSEELPLSVTGSGRIFMLDNSGVASNQIRSYSATGSATYRMSERVQLTGSAAMSKDQSATSFSQAASLSYNGDTRRFREYIYTHSAAVNASNQTTNESSSRSVSGSFGHGLGMAEPFPFAGGRVGVNLSQNASLSAGSSGIGSQSTGQLSNSATLNWVRAAENRQSVVTFNGSDSRSFGGSSLAFQQIGLQGSHRSQIARGSSWTASLSAQGSRSQASGSGGSGFIFSGSGDVSYQNERMLGIPRLIFVSSYHLAANQAADGQGFDVSQSFENRAVYIIGRTALEFKAQFAQTGQSKSNGLYFKMERYLGR